MKIGIVGLGLIGGSLAKTFKKNTGHHIAGVDRNPDAERAALAAKAIDSAGGIETCDVVYVCLYPMDTVQYLLDTEFKPGAILTDVCGVKRLIVEKVAKPLAKKGLLFCGGHPMAGSEGSGFADSRAGFFDGAHYILMRGDDVDQRASGMLTRLAQELGFAGVTRTTPEEHDQVIAYTSQIAHAISAAFVRNPLAASKGFSAGSFEDMTRVARLNNTLWAELFLENSDNLCETIDRFVADLNVMRDTIKQKNGRQLRVLLQESNDIKNEMEGH
jgi:prephenate dehydrogenase